MSLEMVEKLSAFHDGELGLDETSKLRRALADDADARALLESFDRLDDAVREAFDAELDQPVPLALARTVRDGFRAHKRREIGTAVVRWVGPMAAAIAIVVVGHFYSQYRTEEALAQQQAQIAALTDKAVQDALEFALSGSEVTLADQKLAGAVSITPTRTYKSETAHWCREFVEELVIDGEKTVRFGLACREDSGEWRRVETRLEGNQTPPVGRSL